MNLTAVVVALITVMGPLVMAQVQRDRKLRKRPDVPAVKIALNRASSVLLALLLALLLGVLALRVYPYRTVVYNNLPAPVLNSPVRTGTAVVFYIDYCRYTDRTAHVMATLVNTGRIPTPEVTANPRRGCFQGSVSLPVVPPGTPSGVYHEEVRICFRVNPVRSVCKRATTRDFTIVAA